MNNRFSLRNLMVRKNTNSSNESIFNNSETTVSDRIVENEHDLEPRFLRDRPRASSTRSRNSQSGSGSASGRMNSDRLRGTARNRIQPPYDLVAQESTRTGMISELTTDIKSTNNEEGNQDGTTEAHGDEQSKSNSRASRDRSLSNLSLHSRRSFVSIESRSSKGGTRFDKAPPVLESTENRWEQFDTEDLEAESWRCSASAIANAAAVYAERYALMETDSKVHSGPSSRRSSRRKSIIQNMSQQSLDSLGESFSSQEKAQAAPSKLGFRSMSLDMMDEQSRRISQSKLKSGLKEWVNEDPDGVSNFAYDIERGKMLLAKLEEMSIAAESRHTSASVNSYSTQSQARSTQTPEIPTGSKEVTDTLKLLEDTKIAASGALKVESSKENYSAHHLSGGLIRTRQDMMLASHQISDITMLDDDRWQQHSVGNNTTQTSESNIRMEKIISENSSRDDKEIGAPTQPPVIETSSIAPISKSPVENVRERTSTEAAKDKIAQPASSTESMSTNDDDSDIKFTLDLLSKSRLLRNNSNVKRISQEDNNSSFGGNEGSNIDDDGDSSSDFSHSIDSSSKFRISQDFGEIKRTGSQEENGENSNRSLGSGLSSCDLLVNRQSNLFKRLRSTIDAPSDMSTYNAFADSDSDDEVMIFPSNHTTHSENDSSTEGTVNPYETLGLRRHSGSNTNPESDEESMDEIDTKTEIIKTISYNNLTSDPILQSNSESSNESENKDTNDRALSTAGAYSNQGIRDGEHEADDINVQSRKTNELRNDKPNNMSHMWVRDLGYPDLGAEDNIAKQRFADDSYHTSSTWGMHVPLSEHSRRFSQTSDMATSVEQFDESSEEKNEGIKPKAVENAKQIKGYNSEGDTENATDERLIPEHKSNERPLSNQDGQNDPKLSNESNSKHQSIINKSHVGHLPCEGTESEQIFSDESSSSEGQHMIYKFSSDNSDHNEESRSEWSVEVDSSLNSSNDRGACKDPANEQLESNSSGTSCREGSRLQINPFNEKSESAIGADQVTSIHKQQSTNVLHQDKIQEEVITKAPSGLDHRQGYSNPTNSDILGIRPSSYHRDSVEEYLSAAGHARSKSSADTSVSNHNETFEGSYVFDEHDGLQATLHDQTLDTIEELGESEDQISCSSSTLASLQKVFSRSNSYSSKTVSSKTKSSTSDTTETTDQSNQSFSTPIVKIPQDTTNELLRKTFIEKGEEDKASPVEIGDNNGPDINGSKGSSGKPDTQSQKYVSSVDEQTSEDDENGFMPWPSSDSENETDDEGMKDGAINEQSISSSRSEGKKETEDNRRGIKAFFGGPLNFFSNASDRDINEPAVVQTTHKETVITQEQYFKSTDQDEQDDNRAADGRNIGSDTGDTNDRDDDSGRMNSNRNNTNSSKPFFGGPLNFFTNSSDRDTNESTVVQVAQKEANSTQEHDRKSTTDQNEQDDNRAADDRSRGSETGDTNDRDDNSGRMNSNSSNSSSGSSHSSNRSSDDDDDSVSTSQTSDSDTEEETSTDEASDCDNKNCDNKKVEGKSENQKNLTLPNTHTESNDIYRDVTKAAATSVEKQASSDESEAYPRGRCIVSFSDSDSDSTEDEDDNSKLGYNTDNHSHSRIDLSNSDPSTGLVSGMTTKRTHATLTRDSDDMEIHEIRKLEHKEEVRIVHTEKNEWNIKEEMSEKMKTSNTQPTGNPNPTSNELGVESPVSSPDLLSSRKQEAAGEGSLQSQHNDKSSKHQNIEDNVPVPVPDGGTSEMESSLDFKAKSVSSELDTPKDRKDASDENVKHEMINSSIGDQSRSTATASTQDGTSSLLCGSSADDSGKSQLSPVQLAEDSSTSSCESTGSLRHQKHVLEQTGSTSKLGNDSPHSEGSYMSSFMSAKEGSISSHSSRQREKCLTPTGTTYKNDADSLHSGGSQMSSSFKTAKEGSISSHDSRHQEVDLGQTDTAYEQVGDHINNSRMSPIVSSFTAPKEGSISSHGSRQTEDLLDQINPIVKDEDRSLDHSGKSQQSPLLLPKKNSFSSLKSNSSHGSRKRESFLSPPDAQHLLDDDVSIDHSGKWETTLPLLAKEKSASSMHSTSSHGSKGSQKEKTKTTYWGHGLEGSPNTSKSDIKTDNKENINGSKETTEEKKETKPKKSRLMARGDSDKADEEMDLETGLKPPSQNEKEPLVVKESNLEISRGVDEKSKVLRPVRPDPQIGCYGKLTSFLMIVAAAVALSVTTVFMNFRETSEPLIPTNEEIFSSPIGPGTDATFEQKIWLEQAAINPVEILDDRAGYAIALSSEGRFLVVGGKDYSSGESEPKTGIVRIYELSNGEGNEMPTWQVIQSIEGENSSDQYGASLSLSTDGSVLVVGAPGFDAGNDSDTNEGKVYIYGISEDSNSDSDWCTQTYTLVGEDVGAQFGFSVSVGSKGSYIAVGAPKRDTATGAVFVYMKDGRDNWFQLGQALTGSNTDQFGTSVSIVLDGVKLAVGAPGSSGGYVKVFHYHFSALEWTEENLIGDKTMGDEFGFSLSQTPDATKLVVGAPGADNGRGHAYAFQLFNNTYTEIGNKLQGFAEGDRLGTSVDIAVDGTRFSVGLPGRGSDESNQSGSAIVYMINYDDNTVKASKEIYGEDDEDFGSSVSLNINGTAVAISSPRSSTIRTFT